MKMSSLIPDKYDPSELLKFASHPQNVMIDLTTICNQKCIFCYQYQNYPKHGDTKILLSILDGLGEWGVKEILYLGGEPTLHPDLAHILAVGHELGIKQRLISNGQNINKQFIDLFFDYNIEIGISVHGGTQETHDIVTNTSGSYKKALATIKKLQDKDVNIWIQYTPLCSDTLPLHKFHNILKDEDICIKKYDINRLIKYSYRNECDFFPDVKSWWNFLKSLPILISQGIEIHVEAVPHCWLQKCAEKDDMKDSDFTELKKCIRPCWMGFGQLAFSENGNPKLCPTLSLPNYTKNIKWDRQKLMKLWHESNDLIIHRKLDFLGSPCISTDKNLCPEFYNCLGGCRHSSGEIFATYDRLRIGIHK